MPWLLALLLAPCGGAWAGIIASESFSYTAASPLAGKGSAGQGWAGAWEPGPGIVVGTVVSTPISFTPALGNTLGGGNAVDLTLATSAGSGVAAFRGLFAPQAGTIYVAALLKFTGTMNTDDAFAINLSELPGNITNGFGFGFRGLTTATGHHFFIRKGEVTPTGSTQSGYGPKMSLFSASTGTHYLVVKVEKTVAGGNYNKVTGWINPGSNSEVTLPNGNMQLNGDLGLAAISQVHLGEDNVDTGDSTRVDALALATSFADLMAPAGPGAGPYATLRVESAADGSAGVALPAQSIPAGTSLSLYAIARDGAGVFQGNPSAVWSLTDVANVTVPGKLIPAVDGKSAIFTAALAGTYKIQLTGNASTFVGSGILTVTVSAATHILLETDADGSGLVIPAMTLAPGDEVRAYAISRDAGENFIANVAATSWSLTNLSGSVLATNLVAAADQKSATFTASAPGAAIISAGADLPVTPSNLITVDRGEITWSGTGSSWNPAAAGGWFLQNLETVATFFQADRVSFDDTGIANPVVTLVGALSPRAVRVSGESPYTFSGSGKISGPATLRHYSSGLLTILTDNDYSGLTTIDGPVRVGNGGTVGSFGTGDIYFGSLQELILNRSNTLTMTNRIYGGSLESGPILLVNTGVVVLGGTTDNTNASATVAAGATLELAKASSIPNGVKALDGDIQVQAGGTLRLAGTGGNQLGDTATVSLAGLFDLRGRSETLGTLSGAGTVEGNVSGAGTVALRLSGGTFTGVIQDTGFSATDKLQMVKLGDETLVLQGANTFHGGITLNSNSDVRINGNGGGATGTNQVGGFGRFGGTGTTGGLINVTSNGSVDPGAAIGSIGTLTGLNGAKIAGNYLCDINGATSDLLAITGNLDLTGGTFVIQPAGSGVNQPSYVLATYTGTLTGVLTAFPALPAGYVLSYNTPGQIKLALATAYDNFVATIADPALRNASMDPDRDGLANGIEFVLGGNAAAVNNSALLPTLTLITANLGAGAKPYVRFSFRRTDPSAYLNPVAEYDVDLQGTWTASTSGTATTAGVVVQSTNDAYAVGVDRVDVSIPTSLAGAGKIFVRLRVTVP